MSGTGGNLRPTGETSTGDLVDQAEAGIGTTGDPIVDEAKRRFQRCSEWEAPCRERFIEDLKFSYGDSDNGYQWPNAVRRSRDVDSKPCLTMNIIRQHNLQIINDAKRNKSEVYVLATGGGATYDSAEIYRAILSDIQYNSQAQLAYSIAREFQVYGGIGYWRIVTDYVNEDTFDQEIKIEPVIDPLSVYLDPDIKQRNGSDAKFAFVFNDIRRDQFREAYPQFLSVVGRNPLGVGSGDDDWITRDHIRVCEYFRKVYKEDWLISFIDPADGLRKNLRESLMPANMISRLKDSDLSKRRRVWEPTVEWYLIAGDEVIDSTIWMGKYIPIIRVIGEEQVIEGILDRKGHTRAMKDAQRMYNYNAELNVETQVPTPFGWTKIGEIESGDVVFGADGKPVTVREALPVHYDEECFRILFTNGESIITDAGHMWRVEERGKRTSQTFVWEEKTVATVELEPNKHFIILADPLDLPDKNLVLDPYLVGLWLGDGYSSTSRISVEAEDAAESIDILMELGYEAIVSARRESESTLEVKGVIQGLKEIGIFANKHIPMSYLRASRKQRLALLQGLMDADGHIHKEVNQCIFVKSDPSIAYSFVELCASLGIKTTISVGASGIYRVQFTADPDVAVFRLNRKAALQTAGRPTHWRRTKRVGIKRVEPFDTVPVRCITLDTPDHLFLVGRSMIPTHNSAQVEVVALQTKTPWKGAAAAIEEYEQYWNNANTANSSFLPFNHVDDDGNPIPAEALPARLEPPAPSQAFEAGMQAAFNQIMMVSGQYQNQMGMMGNERTGSAIQERMDQGDTATYHFRDNYESALVFTGMQIIDLIPKVYDTARIMMIQADDGSMYELLIDPRQAQALQTKRAIDGQIIQRIFNPNVGRYEVRAAMGQAFGTRRQETVQALTLILTQAPNLTGIIGDLLLSAMDFKEAREAAQRLRRMVPPQALGEGPTANEQNLMAHNLSLTNALREALQRMGSDQLKLEGKDQMRDIDVYKAETERMQALQNMAGQLDPEGMRQTIEDLVREAAHTHLVPILEANRQTLLDAMPGGGEGAKGENSQGPEGNEAGEGGSPIGDTEFDREAAPIPGAMRARDGEWYLPDPTEPGRFLRIAPIGGERRGRR